MKKSRQQMRADERQRIKDIKKENKNFHLKIEKLERDFLTDTNLLKMEIKLLTDENTKLKGENKELKKGYQIERDNQREKQFIENFTKKITEMQKDLDPIYIQFINDNFSELLSE